MVNFGGYWSRNVLALTRLTITQLCRSLGIENDNLRYLKRRVTQTWTLEEKWVSTK